MIGKIFGRLNVIGECGLDKFKNRTFECECDCGTKTIVRGYKLRNGSTKSCGCLRAEKMSQTGKKTKHGMDGTPEYRAFHAAKSRCENKNHDAYHRYGGRGIEFTFSSFEEWLLELGSRPTPYHSVDRIDVNGHYESGNVRWATDHTQNNNREKTVYLTVNGETKCLVDWSIERGVHRATIRGRKSRGWTDNEAVNGKFGR